MKSVSLLLAALLLGGCAAGASPRAALTATMTGSQVAPGPGDSDGTGLAQLRVEPAQQRLCWTIGARQIDAATAAHIHRGAEGSAGPEILALRIGGNGVGEGCVALDPALAGEVATASHRFYVDVHSAALPEGAIRGQLRGAPVDPRTVPR